MMLASSTKPLRDKEDQETPRRKMTVEREKCQTKNPKQEKREKAENKKKENFEIKL
jgi:hypothetical protein